MDDPLSRLQPRSVWGYFATLAAIPRPSKHEERVVAWIRSLARDRGFGARADAVGNLVLEVPGSPGRERAAVVILQAHLDMVCEKNRGTDHDFMKDPIRPRIDGEWVTASGTTLGADNGIGVAAVLAAATDPAVVHGPLELLFTLDEETGLTGAQGLDGSLLRGRSLINLDSEEDGKLFVGCAGGADCRLYVDLERVAPAPGGRAHRIEVRGLRGGHSGIDIHHNRGNALKLLVRLLVAAQEAGIQVELQALQGGSKHNAIPREAEALIRLTPDGEKRLSGVLARMLEGYRSELRGMDEGLEILLELQTGTAGAVLGAADRDRVLGLVAVLPHGVLGMSRDLPGLVETSSNLAVVESGERAVTIVTSSRSSVMASLRAVLGSIRAAGKLAGARVESFDGYPGWKPDMASPLLARSREIFREIHGREPEVTAVHAGLECGLLGQKIPGLDMISFGPWIEGPHSPAERVHIGSVERFWTALVRLLDRISA